MVSGHLVSLITILTYSFCANPVGAGHNAFLCARCFINLWADWRYFCIDLSLVYDNDIIVPISTVTFQLNRSDLSVGICFL